MTGINLPPPHCDVQHIRRKSAESVAAGIAHVRVPSGRDQPIPSAKLPGGVVLTALLGERDVHSVRQRVYFRSAGIELRDGFVQVTGIGR